MTHPEPKTIAIIGAGPVGLAAAAHALERGLKPVVFEAGPAAGHAISQWGHVRMFSPWEYDIDTASARLLATVGWNSPDPKVYPTGSDLVAAYIAPLATRTALAKHIKTNAEVLAVSRIGFDKLKTKGRENAPFEIRYRNGRGPETLRADVVIDASGTWASPSPTGAGGLPAVGEAEHASRIFHGMPDVTGRLRDRYAGKTVAVLGAGHSAVGTLIDLAHLSEEGHETKIIWLLRGQSPEKAFGGGANDKLAARGELGSVFARLVRGGRVQVETNFSVTRIGQSDGRLRIGTGGACCGRHVLADELIVATGFRPDMTTLRELRLSLDPAFESPAALAPLIDPNEHSCGTVRPHGARELAQPDPGLYLAGMKSYGRAPTFLMLTGYEQVRSIVADIAGDHEAAARVELVLPETGVCSRPLAAADAAACCDGPAKDTKAACCAADEAESTPDCGCAARACCG